MQSKTPAAGLDGVDNKSYIKSLGKMYVVLNEFTLAIDRVGKGEVEKVLG